MNTKEPIYDEEALIALRRKIHKNPEIAFQEFETKKTLIQYLVKKMGVPRDNIKEVAKTGLYVDITGEAEPKGESYCVAIRADMDALPMKEDNDTIDFASQNPNAAHMCGHDLHMACLLAGASKILDNIQNIPSNKTVRLLFQPAEEVFQGAFCMIQEGALDGVDEVYGMHNWPQYKPGKVMARTGIFLARPTIINITVIGKGGHASDPSKIRDPLQPAVDIHVGLRSLVKKFKDAGHKFSVGLPVIKSSKAFNVVEDQVHLSGSIRTFDEELLIELKLAIEKLVKENCDKHGCQFKCSLFSICPPVVNPKKQIQYIKEAAHKCLGEDSYFEYENQILGSEDFSFFNQNIPGAMFMLTSQKSPDRNILHLKNYDGDESIIGIAGKFWNQLVMDRLEDAQ